MLARAKGVVRNAVGVVCVISVMAWLALGCGLFGPKAPRVEVLECRARALEPVVGEVLDARELALDLYKGRASLASVLSALEATPAEIVALAQAFDACNGVKSIPAQPEGVSI
jgi:hypothetical protein